MSSRKLFAGLAALAVGVGAFLWAREKPISSEKNKSDSQATWTRAKRFAGPMDHPRGIATDQDAVFVVTGGFEKADNAVLKIDAKSGHIEVLARQPHVLSGELSLSVQHVYFSTTAAGAILRVAKAGGVAEVVTKAPAPTHLSVDETAVYFAAQHEGHSALFRAPLSGGPTERLVSGQPVMSDLVLDQTHVYFRSNSGLWKVDKKTGAASCLLPTEPQRNVGRLAIDDQYLFFLLETDKRGKYAVSRISKQGGKPETIGPVANLTGRLALSDTHVYFFREVDLTTDALAKVPKTGGSPELVDGAGYSTGYLAISGGDAYFADSKHLYRVPK
jgi:hypothetical protein